MNFVLTDNVRAVKDLWIIGDHLSRIAFPYLQQLGEDHKRGYVNYLHENYDHYVHFPSFTETNVLKMVRNSLVEGLNRRIKLPSVIVVMCSEQILTEDPLFLPSEVERKIKWLVREIETIIKVRKGILPIKAYTLGEPRVMWVQLFQNSKANKLNGDNLQKFNNILKRICHAKAIYMLPIDTGSATRCFDFDGRTQIKDGFNTLWLEIANGIKFHDGRDKQYEVAQLVEAKLAEIKQQKQCEASQNPDNLGRKSRKDDWQSKQKRSGRESSNGYPRRTQHDAKPQSNWSPRADHSERTYRRHSSQQSPRRYRDHKSPSRHHRHYDENSRSFERSNYH